MSNHMESVYASLIIVLGLSHLFHGRLWSEFFEELLRHRLAPFFIAIYTAPPGLLIVATHNVWVADVPIVITLMGWGMCLKSAIYLLYPRSIEKLAKSSFRAPGKMRTVGVAATSVGLVVLAHPLLSLPA